MIQPLSPVISISQHTVLHNGNTLWRGSWPGHLNLPEPGHWLSWTTAIQTQIQHGFVMDADRSHFTMLSKDSPVLSSSETGAMEIQLLAMGGAAWPNSLTAVRGLILVEDHAVACASYALRRWRQLHMPLDHILVIVETSTPPMALQPSRLIIPQLPASTIAAIPLFEDWQVASRVADPLGHPGCFDGHAVELAEHYLKQLEWAYRFTLTVWAAGSRRFLEGITHLTTHHALTLHSSSLP